MTTLYQTEATAFAGRNGNVATKDGLLNINLSYPKEMGGSGLATNPEQLFAAGYAACFSNAILHVAREAKVKVDQAPVTAQVGIGPNTEGGFELAVSLTAKLSLPQSQALEIVRTAHKVCPYSNATRGNIDVAVTVNGESI